MVHRESFQLNCDRSILMERLDESTWISIMKRIRSLPLDHDPTVKMRFRALHLSRYNSLFKTRALCVDDSDRILIVVQPVGLTVELPSATHGPTPARDVDRKASRTDSTRLTPGTTETTLDTALCLTASLAYFTILEFP